MAVGPTDVAGPKNPRPEPPTGPPRRRLSVGAWTRNNLFNTPLNSVLTVVFAALLAWAFYRAFVFLAISGRWNIIEVNLTNFMVGRYPRDELYRAWTAIYLVAFVAGVATGLAREDGREVSWRERLPAVAPPLLMLIVFLSLTDTVLPTLLALAGFAVAGIGWFVGRQLPARVQRRMPLVYVATVLAVFAAFTSFGGVGWDNWGGLLLTLYLALGGIVLSFPVGVLLALGRRSSFPAVRVVCVGYIELIRGVPLITLLFMGVLMIGFFFPRGFPTPGDVVRVLIAIILFTAAYVAEIVRGGLQGVPKGQTEAAQAIGLSPIKTTYLIVLPQGLRNVIPALVGQFISLFKDTSLVAIVGLLDLLGVAQIITSQGEFLGQGLQPETLVFAAFVYWVFCYSMSRASQRLEKRLGVGER